MNGAIVLALGAALGATQPDSLPAAMRADVGPWRLSEIGGKVRCTVIFTDRLNGGGHALQAPGACRLAFPPLTNMSAWSLDIDGAPVFFDPLRQHVLTFSGPVGGPFQAIASDGKAWRLEPAPPSASTAPPGPTAPPAPPAPPVPPAPLSPPK